MHTDLKMHIRYMKGIGANRAKTFEKLGIKNILDALYYFPFRYEDRSQIKKISQLELGKPQTCIGWIINIETNLGFSHRKRIEIIVADETGSITGVWFNQSYLKKVFKKGQKIIMYGKVELWKRIQMVNPFFEILSDNKDENLLHIGRIVPIYSLKQGVSQRIVRNLVYRTVEKYNEFIFDYLPGDIIKRQNLYSLPLAIKKVHFPEKMQEASESRKRLAFDDFFMLQLAMLMRKESIKKYEKGHSLRIHGHLINRLLEILPFKLTLAQKRVWREIARDLARIYPMNRILQGDVGCGKTIIALMAMLVAVENGYQAALMAPTEILAEQHYMGSDLLLRKLGLQSALLTGSIKMNERDQIYGKIRNGEINIIFGTHALIQEGLNFYKLGLAVIDEQHRFGVMQRALFREKGYDIDMLIMTATPIPRTLSLTLYGDLDLSIIDESPPGRLPIFTAWRKESKLKEIYSFVHKEIIEGRQVYVVCPLIEESEAIDLKAAVEVAERLQEEIFPEFKVGLLHGRLKYEDKELIMREFKEGRIQILVTTTVIEVGIDIPNASVMLIEHAERFGLAQLHQLRGRVGRGIHKSYCILLTPNKITEDAEKRLNAMIDTNDGFKIAEVDLQIRGPGEFFGTRQSGIPEFKIADILKDGILLEAAREEATRVVEENPSLEGENFNLLRETLKERWKDNIYLATIG